MDELELEMRMTDAEADMATLEDMRENLGQFAVFVKMLEGGECDEI